MHDHVGRTVNELLGSDPDRLLRSDPWRTGIELLDGYLGGGLHAGELTLLGGAPGVGKTTLALQLASNLARSGRSVRYVCYEHGEEELLTRLLLMADGLADLDDVPLARTEGGHAARSELSEKRLAAAVESVRSFGDRLELVRGASTAAQSAERGDLDSGDGVALFVDYLQKVPSRFDDLVESERVTEVVERLKDLALQREAPVVALVAADRSGLEGARLRLHDLRGSTALAYEADVALILNDKHRVVARHHLMYGNADATRYQDYVVCTIEKNRAGRSGIDLELRKRFAHGCFDPEAGLVAETLVDQRVFVE